MIVSFNQFNQLQLTSDAFCPNFLHYISNQTQVNFYYLAKFITSLVLISINCQVNCFIKCASIIGSMENSKSFKDLVLETGISSGDITSLVVDS